MQVRAFRQRWPHPNLPRRAPSRQQSSSQTLFDTRTKVLHRARAALSPSASQFDYFRDHVSLQLIDRLQDVSRPFPTCVDLFCGSGAHFLRAVLQAGPGLGEIERIIHVDVHDAVLTRAKTFFDGRLANERDARVFKEGDAFPVADASADLIVCGGGLHWVNDLPRMLAQAHAALKPDGLLLGAIVGGDSLHELRVALQLTDEQLRGGVAPRISPMVRLRDIAALVAAANFTLPTADVERFVARYRDMATLTRHIRGMGESNALLRRQLHFGRKAFDRAAGVYMQRFGGKDEETGETYVTATFEVMHFIGWKPAASQPVPLARGSASVSLSDLASTSKVVKGDRTS